MKKYEHVVAYRIPYSIRRMGLWISHPGFEKNLKKQLNDCETVLDLGCGPSSPIRPFSKRFYSVGVDAFSNYIKISKKHRIHNSYQLMNIMDIDKKFKPKSFDGVILIDVLEHLDKESGKIILKKAERIAKKKIIISTPNGFAAQSLYDKNPLQLHRSGWTPQELKNRGYCVNGLLGLKWMRGEYGTIRCKPWVFWILVSFVSEFYVWNRPEKARQLFCVKNI